MESSLTEMHYFEAFQDPLGKVHGPISNNYSPNQIIRSPSFWNVIAKEHRHDDSESIMNWGTIMLHCMTVGLFKNPAALA